MYAQYVHISAGGVAAPTVFRVWLWAKKEKWESKSEKEIRVLSSPHYEECHNFVTFYIYY
jgi:hypothetical protein